MTNSFAPIKKQIEEILEDAERIFTAHRAWECKFEYNSEGRLVLRSTGMSGAWLTSEVTAHCDHCTEKAPNPKCGCGIYGLKEPQSVRSNVSENWVDLSYFMDDKLKILVFGTVVMWGRVIEAEHGYRAEHARITSLYVPTLDILPRFIKKEGKKGIYVPVDIDLRKLALDLAASYRVPVYEDVDRVYYWEMPTYDPRLEARMSGAKFGGKRKATPQLDTQTGKVYRSKAKAGMAVAPEYGFDEFDSFVWYKIIKEDPTRFRDATKADIDAHNKDCSFFDRI